MVRNRSYHAQLRWVVCKREAHEYANILVLCNYFARALNQTRPFTMEGTQLWKRLKDVYQIYQMGREGSSCRLVRFRHDTNAL